MFKRTKPFPFLLLCVAVAGCKEDPGAASVYSGSGNYGNKVPEAVLAGKPTINVEPGAEVSSPNTRIAAVDPESGDFSAASIAPMVIKDDYFSMQADEDKDLSVSLNDSYVKGETTFEVVQYPSEGELVMEPNGSFIYYPNDDDFQGVDVFVYEARQGAVAQQATASVEVSANLDAGGLGFTPITPSSDSKMIYVSSSQGDDSNGCESPTEPCQSLAAAFSKVRDGAPDHVYLKRGDVWRDEKVKGLKSGRSAAEPAVLASYGGSGARPKLEGSNNILTIAGGEAVVKHLHIIGLHFDAYKMDPESPDFTGHNDDHANLVFLTDNENVLLEDNLFNYLEIVIQSVDGKSPKNFTLRRNIWTGAYSDTSSYTQKRRPSNVYAEGVDGLVIEENVFDYGGWHPEVEGASANMYNHNVYLQHGMDATKTSVRGNIFARAASHGIQMRSGGIADNNFFGRNAIGLVIGIGGGKACVVNNVVTEGYSMVKGVDPCAGQLAGEDKLCTGAVRGIHFSMSDATGWESHSNITHSLASLDTEWSTVSDEIQTHGFMIDAGSPAVTPTNNHSWRWASPLEGDEHNYPDPSRTLGDYYEFLLEQGVAAEVEGTDRFDKFMNLARSRESGTWNVALSAGAVNDYIRAGYDLTTPGQCI